MKEPEPSRTLELQEELSKAQKLLQKKELQLKGCRGEALEARARRAARQAERAEAARGAERELRLQAELRRKERRLSGLAQQTELLESET